MKNIIKNNLVLLAILFCTVCNPASVFAQGVEPTAAELIDKRYERIYVPETDLAQYWSAVKPGVLLGKKEFEAMLLQAHKAKALNKGQPIGIVVEQIHYQLKVVGDLLQIEASCKISKYKPGWALLTLPVNNVSITEAKLAGKPAPLGISRSTKKRSQVTLVDNFIGTKQLNLKLTTPIQRVGTDEMATFSLFPQAAAQLEVEVPKSRVLRINGSVVGTEQQQQKKRVVKNSVGGKANIQLRFSDSLGESLNESLVFAQTMYSIGVERDSINWQANCQIDLFGKRFNRLQFSVPSYLEIADVKAPGLQGWEMEDDPKQKDHTQITLNFRETIQQQIHVTLQGVQLLEDNQNWTVANLKLLGVTTHTGGLGISVVKDMRLKTLQMKGIRPSVRRWNPAAKFMPAHHRHFYDIWNEDFTFQISSSATAREVQAAVINFLNIDEVDTTLKSTVTLQTLFSPLFELNVELPADWAPEQIRNEKGEVDWQYTSKQAGIHRLRLPISPPLKPGEKRTFDLTIRLNRENNQQAKKRIITLPELKMENVNILEGSFVVRANPRLDVIPANIQGMDPALLGIPGERFGYRYQDSRIDGSFEVVRKPTRFNSTTMQIVSLDEDTISLRYQVLLEASGGGLRDVVAQLSSTATINEEFQTLGNLQISDQQRTKTEKGTRWNLKFDRFVTGKIPLLLTVIIPREEIIKFQVPELIFEKAELQEQFFAFSARTDQRLNVTVKTKNGTALEPIDPADLPVHQAGKQKRIVAGYHAIKPGIRAVVSEEKFDAHAIPTAIGHRLKLTSLLLESGQFQQQAELTFAAVGVQSLMVHIPENATLWSTTIDGVPVTSRKMKAGFVISLTNSQVAGQNRTMQVLYGFENNGKELGLFSTQILPSPKFAVLNGVGEQQPLKILKTEWQIHHAADSVIEPLDPDIEQIQSASPTTWLSRLIAGIFQANWQYTLLNLLLGCLILFIPAGLISLFRKKGWGLIPTNSTKAFKLINIIGVGFFLMGIAFIYLLSNSGGLLHQESMKGGSNIVYEDSSGSRATRESAAESGFGSHGHAGGGSFGGEQGGFESATPMPPEPPQQEMEQEKVENSSNFANDLPSPTATPTAKAPASKPSGDPFANKPAPESDDREKKSDKPANGKGMEQEIALDFEGTESESKSTGKPDGLLSLQLTMQIPDHLAVTQLQSFGSQADSTGLKLRYLSQTAVNRLHWLIIALVILSFWLLRNSSRVLKFSWLAIIIGLPLAAMGIAPEIFLPVLEGLLLGAIAGVLIWFAIGIFHCCLYACGSLCHRIAKLTKSHKVIAGLFLLISWSTIFPANANAKKPLIQQKSQRATPAASPKVSPKMEKQVVETLSPIPPIPPATNKKLPLVFPYSHDKSPLAAERVFVPKQEYLKLWSLSHPEEKIDAAPVAFLVHEATYVAKLMPPDENSKQHTIVVNARFVIRNYRVQEQIVPLPLGPVVLESMEVNGKKSSATLIGKNQPAVLLPGEKLSLVDVQFRLPANAVNAAGQFTIALKPVATGSFSLLLSDEETEVRINEGKIPFQIITRDNKKYVEIVVASGGNYSFSWQPKISTSNMQFLSCESTREVLIRDTGAELSYAFAFTIAQGTFSEVEFQIPNNVKLKSLTGADIAGWQSLENGKLRVLLKRAIDKQTSITLSLFSPLIITKQGEEFQLPDIVPQAVTREIGSWAINWAPSITARFTTTTGVRQVKNDQFKRLVQSVLVSSPQRVYRFSSRPLDLRMNVSRRKATATAHHYTVADIQQHKTHLATFAKINISGEPRLSLDFELPAKLQIIELSATNLSDWFITPNGNNRATLTVQFDSPQMGLVQVVARGHIQQEAGRADSVSFSGLQMKNTQSTVSYLGIGATEILAVSIEAMDGWKTVDPKSLPAELKNMASFPIRLGLQNLVTNPLPVTVSLSRETAQVKAHSVCLVAVTDSSIDYGLSMQWVISKAATDQFSFIGPKWFENRIEFQSPGIRQVKTKSLDEHRVLWTIETRQPQNKMFFVTAAITLPYPEDRTVSAPKINFVSTEEDKKGEEVTAPLEIQGHYVVLTNLGKQPLEPITNHSRLLVQKKELPILIPDNLQKQAMEIVRITDKIVPRWELKNLGKQSSPPAVVSLSQLMTVIDAQGNWRTLARYKVKNRRRQFLPVLLPEQTELLSVMVANRPAKAMKKTINNKQINLIPLPPAGKADLAIEVRVVLQGKLNTTLLSTWGTKKVSLPRPSILSPKDSEVFGIPVMYTIWELSTPDDIAIRRNSKSNMNLSSRHAAEQLALKSKLSEISELSRIISGKSNTLRQRGQAVSNFNILKKAITESFQQQEINKGPDFKADVSLHVKQQQILGEATDNINSFNTEAAQQQSGQAEQSFGRGYIQGNNSDILNLNSGKSGKPRNSTGGQQKAGENPFSPQDEIQSMRINAPKLSPGKKMKGKRDEEKNKSLNRKSLLEENRRQNNIFEQKKRQEPSSTFSFDLQDDVQGSKKDLKDFDGVHDQRTGQSPFDTNSNGIKENVNNELDLISRDRYRRGETILGLSSPEQFESVDSLPAIPERTVLATGKWTAAGGLSLPIDLPTYAQTTIFSKVEGKPELIIEVHSRSFVSKIFGYAWGLAALLMTLWLLSQMRRFTAGENLPRLYVAITVFGLGCFIFLPAPLSWAGIAIAVIASILYAEQTTRKLTKTA